MKRFPLYLTVTAVAVLAGCGSSNTANSNSTSTTASAIAPESRCTTAQLEAALGEPQGTTGTTHYPLNLRNTSTSTCTIEGYADVSFVAGDDDHQIGHAAGQDTGPLPTITLSPGHTVSATLGIEDPANLPADCDATPPSGLRVSPPDQSASLVIDPAGIACANPKYTTLHIGPFQSA
ncbi:MAG: DUF4232 domain-containing protein [Mycobacterium sp.]